MVQLQFNGQSSTDFGLQIEKMHGLQTPKRDEEFMHVPGRNGDVIFDNGAYKNVKITYNAYTLHPSGDLYELIDKIHNWLRTKGYARLEDSEDLRHFRMAKYESGDLVKNVNNLVGGFELVFNCKPQRYLKSGARAITYLQSGGVCNNPSSEIARPLIVIYGTGAGTVTLGDYVISISDIQGSVTINSEIQRCYNGTESRSRTVTLAPIHEYPKLLPGKSRVDFSGGVTKVEITPYYFDI